MKKGWICFSSPTWGLCYDGRGKIIIDVQEENKKSLTIPKLIDIFGSIRNKTFENDEVLLTT